MLDPPTRPSARRGLGPHNLMCRVSRIEYPVSSVGKCAMGLRSSCSNSMPAMLPDRE